MEGRGIDGFKFDALWREDRIRQGKLVVNFIKGIGIKHDRYFASRWFQQGECPGKGAGRYIHRDNSSIFDVLWSGGEPLINNLFTEHMFRLGEQLFARPR